MRVYHATTKERAEAISKEGFKNHAGYYGTTKLFKGVWISNVILDVQVLRGEKNIIFVLDIPEKIISYYEWIEKDKPYREFLVPAKILNRYLEKAKIQECDW